MAEPVVRVELTSSFLDRLVAIETFLTEADVAELVREYQHDDYLILYTVATPGHLVHLLSIRHHRELSFQFARPWVGQR